MTWLRLLKGGLNNWVGSKWVSLFGETLSYALWILNVIRFQDKVGSKLNLIKSLRLFLRGNVTCNWIFFWIAITYSSYSFLDRKPQKSTHPIKMWSSCHMEPDSVRNITNANICYDWAQILQISLIHHFNFLPQILKLKLLRFGANLKISFGAEIEWFYLW